VTPLELHQINLVAREVEASVAFYRLLGLDIDAEPGGVVLSFALASSGEVDATYAVLTAAGYHSQQPPYDAFWGSRYAIVEDPDGNAVGIMGPADANRRYWPPTPPPKA
jgi:uncharacterized glyoxalase superfamily protein PhnB